MKTNRFKICEFYKRGLAFVLTAALLFLSLPAYADELTNEDSSLLSAQLTSGLEDGGASLVDEALNAETTDENSLSSEGASSTASDALDGETSVEPDGESSRTASQPPASLGGRSAFEEESGATISDAESESQAMFAAPQFKLNTTSRATYMSGYSGKLFRPNNYITRAEVAKVIYQLLVNKPGSVSGQFSDVNDSDWYAQAVNALAGVKIVKGFEDGKFYPNNNITRAEIVAVLSYFVSGSSSVPSFQDVGLSSHWVYTGGYLQKVYGKGWIGGYSDGTFKPDNLLTRAEFTKIINRATERHTKTDFASERNNPKKYFYDVTKSHWAFLEIIEAATPLDQPDPKPTGRYIITTTDVNFRTEPSSASSNTIITALPSGTVLAVVDDVSYQPWIRASSAALSKTGFIHSNYVKAYSTPPTETGNGTISATSATVPQFKTLLLIGSVEGSMSGLHWTSNNTSIATVFSLSQDPSKAFIYGKAPGNATISLVDIAGNVKTSCKVTVSAPEAVRFIYSNPVTPVKGTHFQLQAITDPTKTAVRFVVSGAASGTYETTNFTTEQKSATNTSAQNDIRIFNRSVTFNTAGSYTVKAFAKDLSGKWISAGAQYNMLVSATASPSTTTTETRSASAQIVNVIANFEGKRPEVYIDTLSSNKVATVGYGLVVYKNETFYNNLTSSELTAQLLDTINNGGYAASLNKFREKYAFKMNQYQFDALLSFVYNLGPGVLKEDYETFRVLLNATIPPSLPRSGIVYTKNASMYQSASDSTKIGAIPVNATVTVTEIKRIEGNVNNLWYKVSYNSLSGWIRGGNVFFSDLSRDLAYIDEQLFGSNLLKWHKAGSVALPGLFYRRLAEARIFCYGNYADAFHSSPNYQKNPGFDIPAPFN